MRDLDDLTGAIIENALRRIVNGFQPSAFPRLRVNQRVSANANSKGPTETA